jgi:TolA-binding protein
MRYPVVAALLLLGVSAPALSQSRETVDRRIERIEKELRAVQRKVFPGGPAASLEPEISGTQSTGPLPGVPASSALADVNARLDALESQIRSLTAQSEENGYRLRQLEAAFTSFRTEATNRAAEQAAAAAAAAATPSIDPGPAPVEAATGDPGEDAYLAGYRLWNEGRFVDAQKALDAMIKKYPKHPRISYARNLLGRAYLDEGKPATAAKEFLANYQGDPKGDRAADSLYFLGQALVQLKRPAEACKV